MSRATVLARGRRAALASMADTCTIRRVAGQVTDKNTGNVTATYATLYAGKCRVQSAKAQGEQHTAGEDYQLLLHLEVQLPISVTGLQVADQMTITAAVNDPDLAGRTFLIRDLMHKSEATARRVSVLEKTGT